MARTMNQLRMGWIVLTAAGIATAAIAWSPSHAQMMGGGIGGFSGESGGGGPGMAGGAGMPGMGGGGMGMGMIMEDEPVVTWSKPLGPQPDWLERGKKSLAAKEKIRRQLDLQTEVDFNNIPLSFALKEFLADKIGIPFHLDPRGLEQAGKTPEEPITLTMRGTLRDVLNRILQPAGLDYIVLEDGIEVTDRELAEHRGAILAYDLSHFAKDNREGKKIMMLIQTMLSPDRWVNSGGNATGQLIGSVLYVKASESLHCDIEQFLAQLARIDEQPNGPIYVPSTHGESSTLELPQVVRP